MLFSTIIVSFFVVTCMADPINLHTQREVSIVDYTGAIHADVLHLLRGAEILEIRDSNITKWHSHSAAKLPKLRKIILDNCIINTEDTEFEHMFTGATNLKEFYARHITAQELRPDALRKSPLEVFLLTDNNYPSLPGNLLNETKLRRLILSRNHLQTLEEGAFNGLDKLEVLNLDTNNLKQISKTVLAPLKSLKVIHLRENKIEKFSADDLSELPSLETIDLGYNPITNLNLEGLEKVAPKLKTIDITGLPLTKGQIKTLREKHPNILLESE